MREMLHDSVVWKFRHHIYDTDFYLIRIKALKLLSNILLDTQSRNVKLSVLPAYRRVRKQR